MRPESSIFYLSPLPSSRHVSFRCRPAFTPNSHHLHHFPTRFFLQCKHYSSSPPIPLEPTAKRILGKGANREAKQQQNPEFRKYLGGPAAKPEDPQNNSRLPSQQQKPEHKNVNYSPLRSQRQKPRLRNLNSRLPSQQQEPDRNVNSHLPKQQQKPELGKIYRPRRRLKPVLKPKLRYYFFRQQQKHKLRNFRRQTARQQKLRTKFHFKPRARPPGPFGQQPKSELIKVINRPAKHLGHIRIFELNSPTNANAISWQLLRELIREINIVRVQSLARGRRFKKKIGPTRVLIIASALRVFCAGADLKERAEMVTEE